MPRKPLTDAEKQRRRDEYHHLMANPESRKKLQGQRREYHQEKYRQMKDDPILWAEHLRQQQVWRKANPQNGRDATIRSRLRSPEKWLWNQARKRSLEKDLEFTIKVDDICIPELCPIMGKKLEYIPKGFHEYSPSIDRVDSNKGYTPDNIQIISSLANRMKWNSTQEQLLTFCQGVLALQKEVGPC